MRKVVDGKVYDSTKALLIGSYNNLEDSNDINFWAEELYLTRKGMFFLVGFGNACTKYSQKVDSNTWNGGSRLTVLTSEQAKMWLERYCTTDNYIGYDYEAVFTVEGA